MSDYKKMYLTMMDAAEKAINILVQAQRDAEEMYISATDADIKLLVTPQEDVDEDKVKEAGG